MERNRFFRNRTSLLQSGIAVLLFLAVTPGYFVAAYEKVGNVYYAICDNRNAHGSDPQVGPCRKTYAEAQRDADRHKDSWKAAKWSIHNTSVYTASVCP